MRARHDASFSSDAGVSGRHRLTLARHGLRQHPGAAAADPYAAGRRSRQLPSSAAGVSFDWITLRSCSGGAVIRAEANRPGHGTRGIAKRSARTPPQGLADPPGCGNVPPARPAGSAAGSARGRRPGPPRDAPLHGGHGGEPPARRPPARWPPSSRPRRASPRGSARPGSRPPPPGTRCDGRCGGRAPRGCSSGSATARPNRRSRPRGSAVPPHDWDVHERLMPASRSLWHWARCAHRTPSHCGARPGTCWAGPLCGAGH